MKMVYICHFYGKDPERSVKDVTEICKTIIKDKPGIFPVAPQLYFERFIEETPESRSLIMQMCLDLVRKCDEVWVFGDCVSSGMVEEIVLATSSGIPITVISCHNIVHLDAEKIVTITKPSGF